MPSYHITGVISALLSVLASAGLAAQLHLLWTRHRECMAGQAVSEGLSLNRFVTSFVVFWALFVYGGLLNPFNHYLAWPRVLGIFLILLILLQIHLDRRCRSSALAFAGCLCVFLASALLVVLSRPIKQPDPVVLPALVIIVSLIYLQGGLIQIRMIRRLRKTGGLSRTMHLLFVLKDFSLIAFAIAMGLRDGWPILFTCAVGLAVNVGTLWCFYWAKRHQRLSPATEPCHCGSLPT